MSYCKKCGSEMAEDARFCINCGTEADVENGATEQVPEQGKSEVNAVKKGASLLDKLGRFLGIILLILAVLDFKTDPALVTIVVSVIIIAGCVFCLAKKYKGKLFTILAFILAAICLVCGISQTSKIGLLAMPTRDKVIEQASTPSEDESGSKTKIEKESASLSKKEVSNSKDGGTGTVSESDKASGDTSLGVDPELKAFLDSYEEFIDEYVLFMKNYMSNPGDAFSMLSDYTRIMAKYEDFAEKLEAYDADEMSTADSLYYLEVMNRCNMKMVAIY